jgi:hypothetical protein
MAQFQSLATGRTWKVAPMTHAAYVRALLSRAFDLLNLHALTLGPSGGCRIVHHPTKFTPALFSLVEDAPTVDGDGFRGVGHRPII